WITHIAKARDTGYQVEMCKFGPEWLEQQNRMADTNTFANPTRSLKQDLFEHPDFYHVDDLFTDEQKLARESMRQFVKREITPFIEDWSQRATFPVEIVRKFGAVGAFGPTIPAEYGGGGMDYTSYGLIMQEIE